MSIVVSYIALFFLSCTLGDLPDKNKEAPKVVVNLDEEFQTIHSFGGSDCWSAKYIGTWANETKKNQIADLLFSTDTLSDGKPKGIGLSLWRVNIGAGSFEQGEASNIGDVWRREESFQDAKGKYDWSKQAGNQWFLNAARARGVQYTLGFTNSPPVHMTKNGLAFSPGGNSLNLKTERLTDFADFLTEVSTHFKFDYISPINEPQWDWKAGKNGKAGQEGSPAQNSDIRAVAKALSDRLTARGSSIKVVTGEAGQIDYLYGKAESGRGDQLNELFTGATSLRTLTNVEPILAYHSYWSTCDDTKLVEMRTKTVQAAKRVGSPELWQSEFGILGNICGQYSGYPRNTSIEYGLYVAKVIHHDLTITNATSWQWWTTINPYNYSDGLVYINGLDGGYKDHNQATNDGIVVESKQLWSFGNYSRFVRPGMKRINVTIQNHTDLVEQAGTYMISGYKDETTKKIVLVAVNMTNQSLELPMTGLSLADHQFMAYTTDAERSLSKSFTRGDVLHLGAKSVTTFVGFYE